jgi:flagellar protein FliO/FliZ
MSMSLPIIQAIAGLSAITGMILFLAWGLKKIQHCLPNDVALKIIGGVALGQKEKAIIVEVDNKWILLGVTPNKITKLHEFAKQQRQELTKKKESSHFREILKNMVGKP